MIRLRSKECPACSGSGYKDASAAPDAPSCPKCKGSGRLPGTVRRVVDVPGEPRPLVVELREDGVYIREHGRRTTYGPLAYGGLLLSGARLYVEARNQERKGRQLWKRDQKRQPKFRRRKFNPTRSK